VIAKRRRDSSARGVPRNDSVLIFPQTVNALPQNFLVFPQAIYGGDKDALENFAGSCADGGPMLRDNLC
jgi:hypothetical protein